MDESSRQLAFQDKAEKVMQSLTLMPDDKRYEVLIEMGRRLPHFPAHLKIEENLVQGCQSNLYLHAEIEKGKISFLAESDALISAGLAALFISIYNHETPKTILTASLGFLDQLNLYLPLSPGRSNGLNSIQLAMKQRAVKFILVES